MSRWPLYNILHIILNYRWSCSNCDSCSCNIYGCGYDPVDFLHYILLLFIGKEEPHSFSICSKC